MMFRKAAAFALLLATTTDALEILSCLYGYARCLGLPSTNTYETAREWGCVTADGGVNGGALTSQWQRAFGIHSAEGTTSAVEDMDGMPCVLKPDSYSAIGEIADIQLSEIQVIRNDGNNTVAPLYGATLFPAIEASESNTLLLLGDFGFPEFSSLNSVQIKEAVYVGEGLNYIDQGIYMNYATWYTEEDLMKLDGPSPDILANIPVILRNQLTQRQAAPTCRSVFGEGSTSHVIQVVGSGGMSITYDGSREMPYAFSHELHNEMFQLKIGDGTVLTSDQYLGLADFADGENYIDLCLNLSAGVVAKITEHGLKVRLFSTRACNFIVPPKGDCQNDLVGADCGDSATYPHEICVSKIPDGKVTCVIGTDTYEKFDMTEQELASQKCMKAPESSNNSDGDENGGDTDDSVGGDSVSGAGANGLMPVGAALVVAATFVH